MVLRGSCEYLIKKRILLSNVTVSRLRTLEANIQKRDSGDEAECTMPIGVDHVKR